MKTENISWLTLLFMLIACTAQAQLTCTGCAADTPNPIIAADGGTYSGAIVLTADASFVITGSGDFYLSGAISEQGGSFGLTLNAQDANGASAKLILGGHNTYTGSTIVAKGQLGGCVSLLQSAAAVQEEGVICGGTGIGNPGTLRVKGLTFAAKTSAIAVYASASDLSLVKAGEDGKAELNAARGGTVNIMDPITLAEGDYPLIQCKTTAETAAKFSINTNHSGCCVSLIQNENGIYLRVRRAVITGPAYLCSSTISAFTASSLSITDNAPGEWTLENQSGRVSKYYITVTSAETAPEKTGTSVAKLAGREAGTVDIIFTISGCDKPTHHALTVKPEPSITLNPEVHPGVGAGTDLEHNPGSTHIGFVPTIPGTMVTWLIRKPTTSGAIKISMDGKTLEDATRGIALTTVPEPGPLVYKLAISPTPRPADNRTAVNRALLTFLLVPQYTSDGVTCLGAEKSIIVPVAGVEIPADIAIHNEAPAAEINSGENRAKPITALCSGSQTHIKAGDKGDGNLYRWYSTDADNTVAGHGSRTKAGAAAVIAERLILTGKHSPAVVKYYVTPSRGDCDGATEELQIAVNPVPTLSAVQEQDFVCRNAPTRITLSADLAQEETDKVTYTWTVSENTAGATAQSVGVTTMSPQTLTNTAAADQHVTYVFQATYANEGGSCASEPQALEVRVPGVINAVTVTGIEAAAACLGDEIPPLSTEAVENATLKYQWMKDGTPISGARASSYQVSSAEVSSGSYTVTVSNDCETKTSAPKWLNVTADAYFENAAAAADQTEVALGGLVKFTYTGPSAIYSWDFNDGTPFSALQNPTYSYPKAGTWTPVLTVVKSLEQTQCAKKMTLSPLAVTEAEGKVSTGDLDALTGIHVYPVPAKDQITISSQDALTGVVICDASGRNVLSSEASGHVKNMSISALQPGIYILKIINSREARRVKIIREQ